MSVNHPTSCNSPLLQQGDTSCLIWEHYSCNDVRTYKPRFFRVGVIDLTDPEEPEQEEILDFALNDDEIPEEDNEHE